MKYLLRQIAILLALLLFGSMPCYAMTLLQPEMVSSMPELLTWYGRLTGDDERVCGVTAPAVCVGEVTLGQTPCRVDIAFLKGLRVPSGARLVVDNPNLVLMGPQPAITVEAGGVLQIRRWHTLTGLAMPQGGIVVKQGGTLVIESGISMPEGVVWDGNPPPNTLPPPVNPPEPDDDETEKPDESEQLPIPPQEPDSTPEVSRPDAPMPMWGEVLKVTEGGLLSARLTTPRIDPAVAETVTIERSHDSLAWSTEYVFRWNADALGFVADWVPGMPGDLCAKDRIDGSKTDFQYLAKLSGADFYLRVAVANKDGKAAVSDAICLTEPTVGTYPGDEDYEDSGGGASGCSTVTAAVCALTSDAPVGD